MLRLSETNCDSKGHNITLALKDRRPLLPGQDVALITVLGFAGAIGLTCAGLVLFNWKLQHGRTSERTSKNRCCRTLDESLCAHEARNGRAVGYCNCHLTPGNETEVMYDVGSRKETPLRQENSHQAMLAPKSTALDASFRKLRGRDREALGARSCLSDELLQARCLELPGNKKAFYDADLVTTTCCPKTAEKPSNQKHGDAQSPIPPQHGMKTIDMSSDTFGSRYVTSSSTLARESIGKHLIDESWRPLKGKGENAAQSPAQRLLITSPCSKQRGPAECAAGRTAHKHRMGYDHHQDPSKRSKPTNAHPNTSFTCKYVSWDALQDFRKEKKPFRRQCKESEKQQIQINRAIKKFLESQENKDKSRLSAKLRKAYSTKRVKFQDLDLVRAKGLVVSTETPVSWRQRDRESQHPTSLDVKNYTSLEEVKEAREKLSEQQALKTKRPKPSHLREKVKGQNLRIKVDRHPFGKTRVHPEGSASEPTKRHKQARLPPQRPARTSERKVKAKPLSSVRSQLPERSSHAKLTCSKVLLEHALDQTPDQERNGTFRANSLSLYNRSSEQGSCCPVAHSPNGSLLMLPQPSVRVEHQCSQPLLSPEQMENVPRLQGEVLTPPPACLGNGDSSGLASQHFRGVIDHVVMVSTQHTDQNKLKINELNQFALSLGDQVIDTFSKDHRLDENQALQQEERKSSHEQFGSEENPLVSAVEVSNGRVENCIMDGKGIDVGNKISHVVAHGSSPTAWMPLLVPHCLPHQQNGSGRGIDPRTESQGGNGGEGTQAGAGTQRCALLERDADSSAASWTIQMGPTEEGRQSLEGSGKEKRVLCYPSSDKETVSIEDLSKVETGGPQTHNHRPHCRYPGDNQPDRANREHRRAAESMGTPEAPHLPRELNVTHPEKESHAPLILNSENGAENSACKPP